MAETSRRSVKKWFKRIGVAGIIFFTVKGIITLSLMIGAAQFLGC